jgi:hypothetical protein
LLPAEINMTGEEKEKIYFDIIEKIGNTITIPFSLKIRYYFSRLGYLESLGDPNFLFIVN